MRSQEIIDYLSRVQWLRIFTTDRAKACATSMATVLGTP